MKTVIYKENGVYKTTTEENYKRTIRNAREVSSWKDFYSAGEIISYLMLYFGNKYNNESFIVVNDEDFTNDNFIDDEEKMRDFYELTKEEFLFSYSYLTEEEYDNTTRLVRQKEKEAEETMNHYDEGCKKWTELFAKMK